MTTEIRTGDELTIARSHMLHRAHAALVALGNGNADAIDAFNRLLADAAGNKLCTADDVTAREAATAGLVVKHRNEWYPAPFNAFIAYSLLHDAV
jgi:hypothetical protein